MPAPAQAYSLEEQIDQWRNYLRRRQAIQSVDVAELEDHLGARLINRTTRKLALTDVGAEYLKRARQILADVEEAQALASSATKEAKGLVRVLVPPAIAVHQLSKHLPDFHARHPHVTLELYSPPRVNTVDDEYDITILLEREALKGEFVARRLARTEVILCASPAYLDARGRPEHPRDLPKHDVVLPPASALPGKIELRRTTASLNGSVDEVFEMDPPARRAVLSTGHTDTIYAAALHGLGVAGLPSFVIEDALQEVGLERILPEWRMYSFTIWAAMPTRKYVPARTRAFLDFLLEIFGGEDADPWLAAAGCPTQTPIAA